MAISQETAIVATDPAAQIVSWNAIIAGALAATAISFLLIAFGSGLGLSISSTSPTWRDSSTALSVLSGAYLIFVALVSFGAGGYVTGRFGNRIGSIAANEVEFRDGMHGVLAWAIAVILGAMLTIATAHALSSATTSTAQSASSPSVVGENTLAYELDQLFRSDREPPRGDAADARAEAARILLTSSGHSGVSQDDHDYLVRLVGMRTGLSPSEAQTRVDGVIARAHDALKRARESAVVVAFMAAAAIFVGAVVAWLAAREGGRERMAGGLPEWRWSLARRPRM